MSDFGIDYAWSKPSVSVMVNKGVKFACRYLSHDSDKNLTRGEAERLSEAGISVVVVWETTASRALSGFGGGVADAKDAKAQAEACGMPDDRPIYFAVDWDANSSQQSDINAYLDGASSILGRSRVGIYAGYFPLKRAMDAGKAKWGWQTYAWSGGRWDSRAQLQQYLNGQRMDGAGVDYNRSAHADYGQWKVGEDMPLTDADVQKILKSPFNGRGDKVGESLQASMDGMEYLRPKVDGLAKAVAALQVSGVPVTVDLEALAEAVADKLAARLQS